MDFSVVDISVLITVLGVLVALTNIIVEVLKKVTYDKLPTNVVAVLVAIVLTILAGLALFQIKGIAVTWYLILALVVLGFMVAYSAMFGFDKLKEIMNWKGK